MVNTIQSIPQQTLTFTLCTLQGRTPRSSFDMSAYAASRSSTDSGRTRASFDSVGSGRPPTGARTSGFLQVTSCMQLIKNRHIFQHGMRDLWQRPHAIASDNCHSMDEMCVHAS